MSMSTSLIKPTEEELAKHTGRDNVRKKLESIGIIINVDRLMIEK
jgi:hypothetical protein